MADLRRSLPPDSVLVLNRAAALAASFTRLDQYWVNEGAVIGRDPDQALRVTRAGSLMVLSTEMSRLLEEFGKLGPQVRDAVQALSDQAKTLSEFTPDGVVRVVDFKVVDAGLTGAIVNTGVSGAVVNELGTAILRGITDPATPDLIQQTVDEIFNTTGIPPQVLAQGADLLALGDITPASVVEGIAAAVVEAGHVLPPGFGSAVSIFTTAVSTGGAGGDHLEIIPAMGGLIGAMFGVPALGALIGSVIEWIAARVLAEFE